jgi:hypothetical protein
MHGSEECLEKHPTNTWWGVQIIKLLVKSSSPLPCYLAPLETQISSSATYSQTTSAHAPPSMWATKLRTHTKQEVKYVLHKLYARPTLVTTLTTILWVREILAQGQSGRDVKLNTHPASAEVKNSRIYAFTYAHTYAACAGENLLPAFSVRFGSWFVSLFT